jgi:hypothetical protein
MNSFVALALFGIQPRAYPLPASWLLTFEKAVQPLFFEAVLAMRQKKFELLSNVGDGRDQAAA